MFFINDTLSVVLVGDWNRLYIQPDWIAENVYERNEMEIGVNGTGAEFSISYRADDIVITPNQSRIMFTANNTDEGTLERMAQCINNFLLNARTPALFSYGINGDYYEENGSVFAEVLDSMTDTITFIDNGYEIESTKIVRALRRNGRVLNMESNLENGRLMIHFNEHHAEQNNTVQFQGGTLSEFIQECNEIVRGLGYELEGEE